MEVLKPSAITVFMGAIATVLHHWRALLQALLVPSALLIATTASAQFPIHEFLWLPLLILELALITVFAITTHRIVLLGAGSVPQWGFLRWTSRETYFALHLIGFGVVSAVMAASLPVVGVLGLLVLVYFFARVCLVFPAAAIDQGVTILSSWSLTRRHQILMILAVCVFPILIYAPFWLLLIAVPDAAAGSLWFIGAVVDILVAVLVTSVLSLAYQEISRFESASQQRAAADP